MGFARKILTGASPVTVEAGGDGVEFAVQLREHGPQTVETPAAPICVQPTA